MNPWSQQPHMELSLRMGEMSISIMELVSSISFLCIGLLVLPFGVGKTSFRNLFAIIPTFCHITTLSIWFYYNNITSFISMHFIWFFGKLMKLMTFLRIYFNYYRNKFGIPYVKRLCRMVIFT